MSYIQGLWDAAPWWCLPCKAIATGVALLDGPLVNAYMAKYQAAMDQYNGDMASSGQLAEEAGTLYKNYALLHAQAVAAGDQANADSRQAQQDAQTARYLAQVAANDEQIAAQAEAEYQRLEREYQAEQHKAKSTKSNKKDTKPKSHGCGSILSCVANCAEHAASCVTHTVTTTIKNTVTSTVRNLKACAIDWSPGACLRTAATVALVLGTGAEGEVALTAFEQMATSAEAKILGDLAETALAKGPLGALFENGVLTDTIEENQRVRRGGLARLAEPRGAGPEMGEPRAAAGGDAPADRLHRPVRPQPPGRPDRLRDAGHRLRDQPGGQADPGDARQGIRP